MLAFYEGKSQTGHNFWQVPYLLATTAAPCCSQKSKDLIIGLLFAVIDNLVKGASGQAIQNMNLIMGVPEETGLLQQAMFP